MGSTATAIHTSTTSTEASTSATTPTATTTAVTTATSTSVATTTTLAKTKTVNEPPTPSPTPSKVCADTANYIWCKREADKGTCQEKWFANTCKDTCGLCDLEGTPSTPSLALQTECVDTANYNWCATEAEKGLCDKRWFASTCESTCGLCDPKETPAPSPTPSKVCADTANYIWCKR